MSNRMPQPRFVEDILNISVGGKKFSVKKSTLCVDQKSKLYEWFGKPNSTKSAVPQDKAGNYFLDGDGRSFRHIVNYLRFKKNKLPPSLALPLAPDELAKLMAEANLLNVDELSEMCVAMLKKYQRDETTFSETAYTQSVNKEIENWEKMNKFAGNKKTQNNQDDEW